MPPDDDRSKSKSRGLLRIRIETYDAFFVCVGLLSLLPLFAYNKYHLENSVLGEIIYVTAYNVSTYSKNVVDTSLTTEMAVHLVFAACATFSVPVTFNLFLDIVSCNRIKSMLGRTITILSNAIPFVMYLFPPKGYSIVNLYLVLSSSQRIFTRGATLSLMLKFNTNYFSNNPMLPYKFILCGAIGYRWFGH
jgi:hypothetical protein